MKLNKKYVFFSSRSSGNTLFSLNLALLHRQWKPNEKIAYLQLSHFPDVHTFCEMKHPQTILDLKYLIDAGEPPETYPHDTYPSPLWNDWEELSVKDIKNILTFLEKHYDSIYIDIHISVGEEILQGVFNKADKILLSSTIDPASLSGIESFFSKYETLRSRCWLIFHQCPSEAKTLLRQKLKNRDIPILGILPIAKRYLWTQIFEAVPLVFHRKSRWKKALFQLLQKLHT